MKSNKQLLKKAELKEKELCDFCWHGDCDNKNHRWIFLRKDIINFLRKNEEESENLYKVIRLLTKSVERQEKEIKELKEENKNLKEACEHWVKKCKVLING